ncbi:MAG: hypothetical protein RL072_871 [Actinomycetota bacterium]|jgi:hypothetical protein
MNRLLGILVATSATIVIVTSTAALGVADLSGTKCSKVGSSRSVRGVSYQCTLVGKTLKWKLTSKTKQSVAASTTTTTVKTTTTTQSSPSGSSAVCRTVTQIYDRLPNEMQKREWESVVAKLQSVASNADSSGKTTAFIDTFDDTTVGNLTYGRYYPQSYPKEVAETQGGRCAFLALVLDVFVRFTGSDTSDAVARNGIQSVVKALLQEVLSKYTKVDGYDVDVILIEPVLDYCPGREITVRRSICPWNDVGFLYFRTAALSVAQVAATPVSDVFSLGVPGAVYPPRPFDQIVGIGQSNTAVVTGDVRTLVPSANRSHQASTYIEFSRENVELGQTISVESNLAVGSLTLRTVGHIGTVDGRPVSGSGPAVPATIQTRIYRYNGTGSVPNAARRSDFTKQVDVTQRVEFPHYSSVTLNLPSGTSLGPGKYLITFTISGWDPTGAYIRLESFAEGPAGQTDVYSAGRAYRTCNLRRQIGYRITDNPPVTELGWERAGPDCEFIYAEVSKGENPARGMQHTWVWSDLAMTLNAP